VNRIRKLARVLQKTVTPSNTQEILTNTITAVVDDKTVRVQEFGLEWTVPVSGLGGQGLQVGQRIPVVWRTQPRTPVVALYHRVRRAKAGWLIQTGTLVEELFLAKDPETGRLEVWFRNDQQVTNLKVRASLPADPEYVKWGSDGTRFFVRLDFHRYAVFGIERDDGSEPLGPRDPEATLQRIVDLPALNLRLVSIRHVVTGSAANKAIDLDMTLRATENAQQPVVTEVALGSAAAVDYTGDILLTDALVRGEALKKPGAVIQDVQIDDRGHLILTVGLNLKTAAALQPYVPSTHAAGTSLTYNATTAALSDYAVGGRGLQSILWPQNGGTTNGALFNACTFTPTSRATQVGTADSAFGGFIGQQTIVLDATGGQSLWRSCRDPIVVRQARHETGYPSFFLTHWHWRQNDVDGAPADFDWCYLLFSNEQMPVNGHLTGVTFDPHIPDMTFDTQRLIDSAQYEVVQADVPLIAAEPEWFEITPPATALGGWRGYELSPTVKKLPSSSFGEDATWFPAVVWRVILNWRVNETTSSIKQKKGYYLDARYVPRPSTAAGRPRGVVYVAVRQTQPDVDSLAELGLFAVDVETGQPQVLLDLSAPVAGSSAQAGLTENAFHALVRRTLGTDDRVVLVGRTPVLTKTVVAADKIAPFLERDLRLLAPDFLYWPEEGKDDAHVFVEGWDHDKGTLTLGPEAATKPPEDEALAGLGVLQELDVVPLGARNNLADVNQQWGGVVGASAHSETWTRERLPGPSFRVVNNERILSEHDRFLDDTAVPQ